jgi:NADH-quinone oxidoreductase subunit C
MNLTAQDIFEILKEKFGPAVIEYRTEAGEPYIRILHSRTKDVCIFLRDDSRMNFNYLSCLSGVDCSKKYLSAVYHLASTVNRNKVVLKARCTKENPHIQSVSMVWRTADWHEREAYDLFGIIFDGHPDLRRILLPEDWEGYPLRKGYKVQEFYHGMKVPY